MFNIGLVGTGIIGESHKAAILKNSQINLVAVCDIDPNKAEAAAQGCNANVYTDYKAMTQNEKLDCVILNLPHFLHCEVTVYFLEKGVPVLVEKPMANTVEECDKMIAAAKKNNVFLGVGHVQKYFECYDMVKDILQKGTLGELCSITETRNINYFTDQRPKWFLNRKLAGGGIVMNYCAHTMDKIFYVTGYDVDELCAFGNNFLTDDDVEATAQVLVRFTNGVTASLTYCGTKVPTQYETYFYFTKGTAHVTEGGNGLVVKEVGKEDKVYKFDSSDIFEKQIAQLVKMLRGEEHGIVSMEMGKKIIEVNEKVINMIHNK